MLTLIIPAYNASRTIAACIDCVKAQTYHDWHCIIVDDGSRDDTLAIAHRHTEDDERFTVLHKENGGVSSARNAALNIATGEYIVFADSDDTFLPTYLEHLMAAADGADLVVAGWHNVTTGDTHRPQPALYTADEIKHFVLMPDICAFYNAPWANLFRRDIIERAHLRYNTAARRGQDTVFNLGYLPLCRSVALIDAADYQYLDEEETSDRSLLTTDERDTMLAILAPLLDDIDATFHCQSLRPQLTYAFKKSPYTPLLTPDGAKHYREQYMRYVPQATTETFYRDIVRSPIYRFIYHVKALDYRQILGLAPAVDAFVRLYAHHVPLLQWYPSRISRLIISLAARHHTIVLQALLLAYHTGKKPALHR